MERVSGYEQQRLILERSGVRLRAHLATGKFLEGITQVIPEGRYSGNPQMPFLGVTLGTANVTGGSFYSADYTMPIRLLAQIDSNDAAFGMDRVRYFAWQAARALVTDPVSLDLDINFIEGVTLKQGAVEPASPSETQSNIYICRSNILATFAATY